MFHKISGLTALFVCFLLSAQTRSGEPLPLPGDLSGLEPGVWARYKARSFPSIRFSDSPRLDSLVRAGTLYLSLHDAVALAIENNLDVELTRLTPLIAESD